MNDELPDIFEQLRPCPPAELRARVLAGVNRELARRRKPRWERLLERSVAASFLLGVALNVWQFTGVSHTSWSRPPASAQARPARSPVLALGDEQLDELVQRRMALRTRRQQPRAILTTASEQLVNDVVRPPAG